MIDRHFIGDVALAVLLAIPIAVLARPDPVPPMHQGAIAEVQQSGNVSEQDRPVSLLR